MITNDVSTLKIHKLTQAQYDRELAAGRLDENALYLTPDDDIEISDVSGLQAILDSKVGADESATVSLSHLKNGKGGVLNWLWVTGSDGGTDYVLVPRSNVTGTTYDAYLGDASSPFLGVYTGFVQATGSIQTTGNMTSKNVTVGGNVVSDGSVSGGGIIQAKNQLYSQGILTVTGDASIGGVTTVSARIQPYASQQVNLGLADKRWMNIYSNAALNVSSDLNVKKDIVEIDDRYIEMFDLIQPYAYKFIDGTSGRTHTGFISQYVEQAMEQVGLTAEELGFFCKDAMYEEIKDEDGNVIERNPILDEDGNQKYFYSLRYEEYIAIMVEKMKRMEKRIDELETKLEKVDEIEARLASLETA